MFIETNYVRKKYNMIFFAIIYKVITEISFWKVLTVDYPFYEFSFNIVKYINGLFWVLLSLFWVDYRKKKASSFFLFFLIVMQIIPISSFYALTDNNSPLYYNALSMCFALCEYLVARVKVTSATIKSRGISRFLLPVFLHYP